MPFPTYDEFMSMKTADQRRLLEEERKQYGNTRIITVEGWNTANLANVLNILGLPKLDRKPPTGENHSSKIRQLPFLPKDQLEEYKNNYKRMKDFAEWGKINIADRKELITAWIEKKIKPADLAKHFGKSPSYWYNYMHRVKQSPALRPSATVKQISATIEEAGEIIDSEPRLDSQRSQLDAIPSKKNGLHYHIEGEYFASEARRRIQSLDALLASLDSKFRLTLTLEEIETDEKDPEFSEQEILEIARLLKRKR